MKNVNASTKLYCIFGNPVKHSLSPVIQNAAFESAGLNAVYLAFEVEDIKNGVSAMKTLDIIGASITIPFKTDVMDHLNDIDSLAEDIGSVNTLHNVNGKITGYNTDGYGALNALLDNDVTIKGANVLIIGNGGSARAVAFTLLQEGADIIIAGRNIDKILRLVNDLKKKKNDVKHTLIKDIAPEFMKQIDIIINTTPIGMTPDIEISSIDESLIIGKHVIFDIVYSPDMTRLLQIAKSKNCKIIRGIEMLINQGAKQFEIWTGEKAPVSLMRNAIKNRIK